MAESCSSSCSKRKHDECENNVKKNRTWKNEKKQDKVDKVVEGKLLFYFVVWVLLSENFFLNLYIINK